MKNRSLSVITAFVAVIMMVFSITSTVSAAETKRPKYVAPYISLVSVGTLVSGSATTLTYMSKGFRGQTMNALLWRVEADGTVSNFVVAGETVKSNGTNTVIVDLRGSPAPGQYNLTLVVGSTMSQTVQVTVFPP